MQAPVLNFRLKHKSTISAYLVCHVTFNYSCMSCRKPVPLLTQLLCCFLSGLTVSLESLQAQSECRYGKDGLFPVRDSLFFYWF